MKTANLHVDNIAPTLACMEVLTSVAKRLALRDWRITHEAEDTAPSGETLTSGFVGVEISRFSKTYSERHLEAINALIDPLWETYYGWFGAKGKGEKGVSPHFLHKHTSKSSWVIG